MRGILLWGANILYIIVNMYVVYREFMWGYMWRCVDKNIRVSLGMDVFEWYGSKAS